MEQNKHHPERISRLLAAFRAGKNGRPLQCKGEITMSLQCAHRAGFSLKNGERKNAMISWRNARYLQGKRVKPFTENGRPIIKWPSL